MTKPLLAVVIGDPSGVGPEVCVRALATGRPTELAHVVLVGSRTTIDEAARISGVELPLRNVTSFADARAGDDVAVLDDGALRRDAYVIGKASAAGGAATYAWIQRTIAAAEAGDVDAIVVAPIDRSSWKLAGITGVTDEMHPPGTYLLRTTGNLRTIPIGEHVPFRAGDGDRSERAARHRADRRADATLGFRLAAHRGRRIESARKRTRRRGTNCTGGGRRTRAVST